MSASVYGGAGAELGSWEGGWGELGRWEAWGGSLRLVVSLREETTGLARAERVVEEFYGS